MVIPIAAASSRATMAAEGDHHRMAPSKVAAAIVRAETPAKLAAARFIRTPLCKAM
jgi:hypothetical protein